MHLHVIVKIILFHLKPLEKDSFRTHLFFPRNLSPCYLYYIEYNISCHYPLEHYRIFPDEKIGHNKMLNTAPKSLSHLPYDDTVTVSDYQHSVHSFHDDVKSERTSKFLNSNLQEKFSTCNASPISQITVPKLSPNRLFCTDISVNDVDLYSVSTKKTGKAEDLILQSSQALSNIESKASSPIMYLNDSSVCSTPIPLSSSSSTSQHANSPSEAFDPLIAHVGSINKSKFDISQSAPSSSFDRTHSGIYVKEANTAHNSRSELIILKSKTNEAVNKRNEYENINTFEPAQIYVKSEISAPEPLVVLTKLSLENQLLAQKSIRKFLIKMKKTGISLNPVKVFDKFEISDNSSQIQSLYVDRDLKTKIPQRKCNNEYFPDLKNSEYVQDKRSKKRLRSTSNENNASTCSNQTKKRRRISSQAKYVETSTSEDDKSDGFSRGESTVKLVSSTKPNKWKNLESKSNLNNQHIFVDEFVDLESYDKFSCIIRIIFDSMEGIDFSTTVEEDVECEVESLIPLPQLQELNERADKVKRFNQMNQFTPELLVKLLAILERNIIDGARLLPVQIADEQDEGTGLSIELTMERVMRSAYASVIALHIMTSPDMSKKVLYEDILEKIIFFLKYQIQNTVFPVFDSTYKLKSKSNNGYAENMKQKCSNTHKIKDKSTLQLYNKLNEAISILNELLEIQILTDTLILQILTIGVKSFFVEGISKLQLNALRLVTNIFARYDNHRELILEDILTFIYKNSNGKRNIRNYHLNSGENIQMLTALLLQLIHSIVRFPELKMDTKSELISEERSTKIPETENKFHIKNESFIINSYNDSVKTAISFITEFLKHCGTKNEEMDYRPLFDNFVQDLFKIAFKPEWPAAELLLSVLGGILVKNLSKSIETPVRVASLDYLGVLATSLLKNTVKSQNCKDMITEIIQGIVSDNDDTDLNASIHINKPFNGEKIKILQKALFRYLSSNEKKDYALVFCSKFYIAQWYRDTVVHIKHLNTSLNFHPKESEKFGSLERDKKKIKLSRTSCLDQEQSSHLNYEVEKEKKEIEDSKLKNYEINAKNLAIAEERKQFLLDIIKRQQSPKVSLKQKHIDYETAELISHYLASTRNFSKSFDLYLAQILCALNDTAVSVRTKAVKCLALVVEADPSVLARSDIQKGVHGRLLDNSISVREAAVDLLGKFLLIRPELINQYYEMLTARILDTGISVRKRVIKILKNICLGQLDFPQIPEVCVKIIRRVNDEEGIRKLVEDVFQSMWFNPVKENNQNRIRQKVENITHVIKACRDIGLEWFEQLLTNLLKNKEGKSYECVVNACQQIVDFLVENLLELEESPQSVDYMVQSSVNTYLATLYLFSKIHPLFVVPHATKIQIYLSRKCNNQCDFLPLKNVAQIIEILLPFIEYPSELFLTEIEESMVKLILRQQMGLLPSCISCLSSVINTITHNTQIVKDCFQKFLFLLLVYKKQYDKNSEKEILKTMRPKLLKSLYAVGLFCRHFDLQALDTDLRQSLPISFKDRVFEIILYFSQCEDEDIRLKALSSLGFIMTRHYEFMLGPEVKILYHDLLTSHEASSVLKCQVLKNFAYYLVHEDMRMAKNDVEWKKTSKFEDLKEMEDVISGMASTVVQVHLRQILECVLHSDVSVRKATLSIVELILGQGLIHPVQMIEHLICFSSEDAPMIRTKADELLQEIWKKYPSFIQMRAMLGVRMSYKLHKLIQVENEILRGYRCSEIPVSRNGFLYSVMRSIRQNRRAFLLSLLKLFDEHAPAPLTELLYIADNIAYFPYTMQDEPLFIINQLNIILSVSGSNLIQTFCETLLVRPSPIATDQSTNHAEVMNANALSTDDNKAKMKLDDHEGSPDDNEATVADNVVEADGNEALAEIESADDHNEDDDFENILERLPEDITVIQKCIIASQGCILLLHIKEALKGAYSFTDSKIEQYSPSETTKVYERPLNRKCNVQFNPESVLSFIKIGQLTGEKYDLCKEKLVSEYLSFKKLMLMIDQSDEEDDDKHAKQVTFKETDLLASNPTVNIISNLNSDETTSSISSGEK